MAFTSNMQALTSAQQQSCVLKRRHGTAQRSARRLIVTRAAQNVDLDRTASLRKLLAKPGILLVGSRRGPPTVASASARSLLWVPK